MIPKRPAADLIRGGSRSFLENRARPKRATPLHLGRAGHQERHVNSIVVENVADHRLDIRRGAATSLAGSLPSEATTFASGPIVFSCAARKCCEAKRRYHRGLALEHQVGHEFRPAARERCWDRPTWPAMAPFRSRRRRRHVARDERQTCRPAKSSGGQVENAIRPPMLEHAEHLLQRHGRTRREDVPELAEHDVERRVRIRQRLGVAFDELDIDAGECRHCRARAQAAPATNRGRTPWRHGGRR